MTWLFVSIILIAVILYAIKDHLDFNAYRKEITVCKKALDEVMRRQEQAKEDYRKAYEQSARQMDLIERAVNKTTMLEMRIDSMARSNQEMTVRLKGPIGVITKAHIPLKKKTLLEKSGLA